MTLVLSYIYCWSVSSVKPMFLLSIYYWFLFYMLYNVFQLLLLLYFSLVPSHPLFFSIWNCAFLSSLQCGVYIAIQHLCPNHSRSPLYSIHFSYIVCRSMEWRYMSLSSHLYITWPAALFLILLPRCIYSIIFKCPDSSERIIGRHS